MRTTAKVVAMALGVALASGIVACGDDDTDEAEDLRSQLVEMTAERDELQAQLDADAERYDKTVETRDAVRAILDDPTSYGTDEEVAELLASHATPDAQMRDDVFGDVPVQSAWYYTLYGSLDAEIDVVERWFAPDGSQSGGLWVWRGTNEQGKPFELIGVQIDTHDDQGRLTDEWVFYPYPDEYVIEAIRGEGTAVTGLWDD